MLSNIVQSMPFTVMPEPGSPASRLTRAQGYDAWRSGAVALDVVSASRAGAADIASRQSQRLHGLLASAMRRSPLYSQLLRGLAPDTPLHDLPVVTKPQLMQRFDDWVADPRLKREELLAFTADPGNIGKPYLDDYHVWQSSGSTGDPALFVLDPHTLAVYDALETLRRAPTRTWRRVFDPMCLYERMAFVGATTGHFASTVSVERVRSKNPWMRSGMQSLSFLRPVGELVDELNRFSPTILATYPTAAVVLAEQARLGALRISPQEVLTGGEMLTAAMRHFVQEAFGCSVRNSYGASEFLPAAWECAQGHLHVNADWVILEPVDARLRPTAPGEWSHTTLLTNLANHTQPLIRYDLGDSIRLSHEPCTCGSSLPVMDIQGRIDDVLTLHDPRGKPVHLLPLALATVFEEEAGVYDFQVIQQGPRRLQLRVGSPGAKGRQALERCREALKPFLKRHGLEGVAVVIDDDHAMLRGYSGKVRRVIADARQEKSRGRRA